MNLVTALSRTSRLGAATALGTAFGILVLCLVFQFVVPVQGTVGKGYLGQANLNFRSLILYATAGGMHILLCTGSIVFFFEQLRRGEAGIEFKKIIVAASIVLFLVFTIVLLACHLDMNVVGQSYDERVRPLQDDSRLTFLFAKHAIILTQVKLQWFALLPLCLTFFGIAAAVMASFWISHKAITFALRADDLKKSDIVELHRSLTQLIGLVAVVFTTSTVATIALMQIGRDWIENGALRDAYIQNGHAMSIFWSACYTSVIILIVILPLWWIANKTRRIQRQAKYAGGHPTFFDQVFETVSYKSVAQAGGATLAPLLTSSLAAVFGS